MKKPHFLIGFVVLLILIVGMWKVLNVQARLFNQKHPVSVAASLEKMGTQVVPTITVSTATTNCDTKPIPNVTSDAAGGVGSPAIKPHLCTIPAFTEQDVRQYMGTISRFTSLRIEQSSPHFTVTRVLFVTNKVANEILNADTGVTNDNLVVCYVEVYGDFTVAAPPFAGQNSKQTLLHHGEMVFDGVTGNMLVIGVRP